MATRADYRSIIAALLIMTCVPAAEALDLKLPTRDEWRAMTKDFYEQHCLDCVTVTAIEVIPGEERRIDAPSLPGAPGQPAGLGRTVPILTDDAPIMRDRMFGRGNDQYSVTVRNDEGALSRHVLAQPPGFAVGDRVRPTPDGLESWP